MPRRIIIYKLGERIEGDDARLRWNRHLAVTDRHAIIGWISAAVLHKLYRAVLHLKLSEISDGAAGRAHPFKLAVQYVAYNKHQIGALLSDRGDQIAAGDNNRLALIDRKSVID